MDQLPRQCLALPCANLVDAPGGYRGATFGECTPIAVSPAITTHCLVAPNFDRLRCVYDPSTEQWRVDQSAIEWTGHESGRPNGQRIQEASLRRWSLA